MESLLLLLAVVVLVVKPVRLCSTRYIQSLETLEFLDDLHFFVPNIVYNQSPRLPWMSLPSVSWPRYLDLVDRDSNTRIRIQTGTSFLDSYPEAAVTKCLYPFLLSELGHSCIFVALDTTQPLVYWWCLRVFVVLTFCNESGWISSFG